MSKLDSATAGRVTADWAGIFGGFDVLRPLRLIRRIGPVIQGITLDRTTVGDSYFPTAHIHALTREFPVISLSLGQRLVGSSGVQESVRFSRHEKDFHVAAQRLAAQSNLSLLSPPTIIDIVGACRSFAISQQEKGHPPAVDIVEDGVLIPAANGDLSLIEDGLRLARELVGVWPKSRLPIHWKGDDIWLAELEEKAADVESLSKVIDSQVLKHKLAEVRTV